MDPTWYPDGITAESVHIRRREVGVEEWLSRNVAQYSWVEIHDDPIRNRLRARLIHYIASSEPRVTQTGPYRFPATWWDAFKDRWFPLGSWLRRKFPAKYVEFYERTETVHACPHTDYDFRDRPLAHIGWLKGPKV